MNNWNDNKKLTPEQMMEMGAHYYAEKAAGRKLTELECARVFGRNSDSEIRASKTYYRGFLDGRDFRGLWDGSTPRPARKEIEAALRRMETEFDLRVRQEAQQLYADAMEEYGLPELKRLRDKLDLRKGRFTKEQYMTILSCLHPDNSASDEKRAEAFRLVREAEVQLMDNHQHPVRTGVAALPTSREELLARRAARR